MTLQQQNLECGCRITLPIFIFHALNFLVCLNCKSFNTLDDEVARFFYPVYNVMDEEGLFT